MLDLFLFKRIPFVSIQRWVCTSGFAEDLDESDKIAAQVLETFLKQSSKGSSLFSVAFYLTTGGVFNL